MDSDTAISSSLQLEKQNGIATISFRGPFPSLPSTESLTVRIDSKDATDLSHVGEQLWVGSLLVSEYLLNL